LVGAVIEPRELLRGRRKALSEAARDLAPQQFERVKELLERWDEKAREELFTLLGRERAKKLLEDLGL
jgi:vacuolar-type H+-ATPase subunit E/Vma4